ncbi:hypothetical protein ACW73L_11045 [Methylolobus aquaticus]
MNTKKAENGSKRSAARRKNSGGTAPVGDSGALRPPDAGNVSIGASTGQVEGAQALEHVLETLSVDHQTAERLQKLPRDVGWLLMTAGVVGVVMPGVLGVPFLLIGGLIVSPATNKHAERWLSGHAPGVFKGSIRQINRFLDDLERRYPRRSRR